MNKNEVCNKRTLEDAKDEGLLKSFTIDYRTCWFSAETPWGVINVRSNLDDEYDAVLNFAFKNSSNKELGFINYGGPRQLNICCKDNAHQIFANALDKLISVLRYCSERDMHGFDVVDFFTQWMQKEYPVFTYSLDDDHNKILTFLF